MEILRLHIQPFLRRNALKIGIISILAFIALRKDLSFNLNLNTPAAPRQEAPAVPEKQVKVERYTEGPDQGLGFSSSLSATDRFDFSGAGGGRAQPTAFGRLADLNKATVEQYIERFGKVAKQEQEKFGIPAAIILANALLHSQAGEALWAKEGRNNHFLIPCTPDWQGEQKNYDGRCLRQYHNAWTSFRDHSFFITTGTYSPLQQIPSTDIKGWAEALEQKGFSAEPELARQLLAVIDRYGLE